MFRKKIKNLKEKIECEVLAKEFSIISNIRRKANEKRTKEYIEEEYIKYCVSNGILITQLKENVDYAFNVGLQKGSIDKYTLLTEEVMNFI